MFSLGSPIMSMLASVRTLLVFRCSGDNGYELGCSKHERVEVESSPRGDIRESLMAEGFEIKKIEINKMIMYIQLFCKVHNKEIYGELTQ